MKMIGQRLMSIVIIGIVVAGVLALLIVMAIFRQMEPDELMQEFSVETTDRDLLEADADIKFPPSTANVRGYVTGFRELTTYVRFEIDPGDLQLFLDSTMCATALEAVPAPAQPEFTEVSWWDLNIAGELMYCGGRRDAFGQGVWVAISTPNLNVIYVITGN